MLNSCRASAVGWEIMSALFSVTLHNPNLSVIASRPHCWNIPHVLPHVSSRADRNYNTSWLLSLMPLLQGGIHYVSCDLTCCSVSSQDLRDWLQLPERGVAGDLFEMMPLRGQGATDGLRGGCSVQLPIAPFVMPTWLPGTCSCIPPQLPPSTDLLLFSALSQTQLSTQIFGRKTGGIQVGQVGTWFACLLVKKILQGIMCLSLVATEGEVFSSYLG